MLAWRCTAQLFEGLISSLVVDFFFLWWNFTIAKRKPESVYYDTTASGWTSGTVLLFWGKQTPGPCGCWCETTWRVHFSIPMNGKWDVYSTLSSTERFGGVHHQYCGSWRSRCWFLEGNSRCCLPYVPATLHANLHAISCQPGSKYVHQQCISIILLAT